MTNDQRVRKQLRLHPDVAKMVDYWSAKERISENEYISLAIEEKVSRANGDYELPTLEQYRLNQLIDAVTALSTNQANLERVIVSLADSLLGLTRGDSYLLDEEDGELDGQDEAGIVAGG